MAERPGAFPFEMSTTQVSDTAEIADGGEEVRILYDTAGDARAAFEENDGSVFHDRDKARLDHSVTTEGGRALSDPVSGAGTISEEPHFNDAGAAEAASDPGTSWLETEGAFRASNDNDDNDGKRAIVAVAATDGREAVPFGKSDAPLPLVPSKSQPEPLADKTDVETSARGPSEYSAQTTVPTQGSAEPQTCIGLKVHAEQAAGEEEVTSMEPTAQEVTPLATPVPQEEGKVNGEEEASEEGPSEAILGESQDELEEDEEEEEDEEGSQGASPRCSSQASGEAPPSGGQKKPVNGSGVSKYNTVSYRKIRKGNTKQRIDEFESMMNS